MPNSFSTFRYLAKKPSKKSKKTPKKIKIAARYIKLFNVKIIEITPQHKFDKVK